MSTRRAALRASSALASGQSPSSSNLIHTKPSPIPNTKKENSTDPDDSDLSSVPSDLEDVSPFFEPVLPMKKRKRELDVLGRSENTRLSFSSSIQRFRHKDAFESEAGVEPEPKKKDVDGTGLKAEAPTTPTKGASKKPLRSPKKRAGVAPPKNWEEMLNRVREMRKLTVAPVDTMGCERLALDTVSAKVSYWSRLAGVRLTTTKDKRFQTLISLMLSSQTKDTVNAIAMNNLQTQLPGGLNLQSILEVQPAELDRLIRVVRLSTEHVPS
jgi:endonuclease III